MYVLLCIHSNWRNTVGKHIVTRWINVSGCNMEPSKFLTVSVVCIAMFVDLLLTMMMVPILPDMLKEMNQEQYSKSTGIILNNWTSNVDVTLSYDNISQMYFSNVSSKEKTGSLQDNLTEIEPHSYLSEARYISIVLITKPVVETLCNMLVGYTVDVFGHKYPLIVGSIFSSVSTLSIGLVDTFELLVVFRVLQGVGGSLSTVSGLSLIDATFTNSQERAQANALAIGAAGIGILLANPFGSVFYYAFGKLTPFLIVAILSAIDGVLRLFVVTPFRQGINNDRHFASYFKPLKDVYIIIGLTCTVLAYICVGSIMLSETSWLMDVFNVPVYKVGLLLATGTLSMVTFGQIAAKLSAKLHRSIICSIGMFIAGVGSLCITTPSRFWLVILPQIVYSGGFGMFHTNICQLLGHIMTARMEPDYGILYGMILTSTNLGIVVGEAVSGAIVEAITVPVLFRGLGIMMLLLTVPCLLLYKIEKLTHDYGNLTNK